VNTRTHKVAKSTELEELIVNFVSYDTDHIDNDASNNSSIVACVFVVMGTFLPSRCLATIAEYTLMEGIYKVRRLRWAKVP
jgi:hypothetical protein